MKKDNNKNSKSNKILKFLFDKKLILIVVVVLVSVVLLLFFNSQNKDQGNFGDVKYVQEGNDELSIGEKKYLEFLWMVDGAFNYERYNHENFFVNDRTLERQPNFSCVYDNAMKTCQGINFEDNFHKLFASNIKLDIVYGDGLVGSWYEKRENNYLFTNINNCNAGRMNTKQKLTVSKVEDKKITYTVTYDEELKQGIFKGNHHFEKDFVLVYESGDWKISEAYYHDPCYMDYDIK